MDIFEGHILSFFPSAACPWTPREDHACGNHGHNHVVDRAGISETGILKI